MRRGRERGRRREGTHQRQSASPCCNKAEAGMLSCSLCPQKQTRYLEIRQTG